MATRTIQILHLRLKECEGRSEHKDCKSQGTRKAAVRCCLLKTAGKLHPGDLNSMAAELRPEQGPHQ